MLQPFDVADATRETYRRYVRASFPLRDPQLDEQRERLIDGGLLWTEPFVSLGRPGRTGPPLADLAGRLDARTLELPWGFDDLYDHQHRAIDRLRASRDDGPRNTLVLSGTGSGKTESFLIPIIDACLRDPEPGVKAVVLYPMNALANDQLNRLIGLLRDCPDVTFGRYTGDAPETDAGDHARRGRPADLPPNVRWSRNHMRTEPPDILLTNYTMLEYLLLRGKDQQLFAQGRVTYLVVDEIHLFTGVLGAEVACLLRRFRQHLDKAPTELCVVGTSATAGSEEERGRLLEFARRFFGAPFDDDAAIEETPAPLRDLGPTVPPQPALTDADIQAAGDTVGLAAVAHKTLGVQLPADDPSFAESLGTVIDDYHTVGLVERALARPAPISVAAKALAELDARDGASVEDRIREATALVLLGAAARQRPVGEDEPEPRFRPRVHQIVRSLAGLWRCLDPGCGQLAAPTTGRCGTCNEALTLPIAACRTCGEAYWTAPTAEPSVAGPGRLEPVEAPRGHDALYLADPDRLTDAIDQTEDGDDFGWIDVWLCPTCGGKGPSDAVQHHRACTTPSRAVRMRASNDPVNCPSCGDKGAGGRPILLPLRGSAAASVAVLTQTLSDELRHRDGPAAGRLLVFADSRQDAAQQAGYADDQGARIAVRQLLLRALDAGPAELADAIARVREQVVDDPGTLRRWLLGESERAFAEIAHPDYQPSSYEEKVISRQLAWEIVLDVTERARRRFTLEREGLLVIDVDRLDELAAAATERLTDNPFTSPEQARQVVRAVIDILRYRRAVDHWMLKVTPRALRRNHDLRIADRAVLHTRGWGEQKFTSNRKQVDIRSWTSPPHVTTFTELFQRVLQREHSEVIETVEAFAEELKNSGLLASSTIEGRTRWMVDHHRLRLLRRDNQPLWRCGRCGLVRSAVLTNRDGQPICVNWRCTGVPQPWEPDPARDFYRRQYLASPRRLLVREHSGQVTADERIALEERFNDRAHPTIDAIACTPTLEVGVSLDDLHAVMLRNLPPTPANYAQRIGRAGRRSKVALAVAHAGAGPHDTYYFEHPDRMVGGDVRAPAISLDNEPLLRRHINSLIFELLGEELPDRWVPDPESDEPTDTQQTVADTAGVLRESAIEPFRAKLEDPGLRGQLLDRIQAAFAAAEDPSPPADARQLCEEQLDAFLEDLRASLRRWCDRFRRLLDEHTALSGSIFTTRTEEENRQRDRIERELKRLVKPGSPEYRPLGFLGLVGFLPRYGFTDTTVLLHPPGGEEPIGQAASVAVTEYAPANLVYARGRRLKVLRLDPAPVPEGEAGAEHRDNVIRDARRCDACDFLTFDLLVKSCPSCQTDLRTQQVIGLTGVAAAGGAISSDDEYRSRNDYDVAYLLGSGNPAEQELTLAGFPLRRYRGREIIVANRGPQNDDDTASDAFTVCVGCGYTDIRAPDDEDDEDELARGHAPRCPGRKDRNGEVNRSGVWLTAQIRGDVVELDLPPAARGPEYAAWRTSLAEALLLGMREVVDADRRDLNAFERRRDKQPHSLVLYDTMPGGTGYLPKLFADGSVGFKQAAGTALERLESCDCEQSCHRCLQDFWNQRVHRLLDRHEVVSALRRIAGAQATEALDADNDELESFLEREFFERLQQAGLPEPTLQVTRTVREHGRPRIITRVDATYRDPNIAIYLDGSIHRQSASKILEDLDRRNRLEAQGDLVLEYTFDDIMRRFEDVAADLRRALTGDTDDPDLNPEALPELPVSDLTGTQQAVVDIDPDRWVHDKAAWQASLHSANRLRLAGWRLRRIGVADGST